MDARWPLLYRRGADASLDDAQPVRHARPLGVGLHHRDVLGERLDRDGVSVRVVHEEGDGHGADMGADVEQQAVRVDVGQAVFIVARSPQVERRRDDGQVVGVLPVFERDRASARGLYFLGFHG